MQTSAKMSRKFHGVYFSIFSINWYDSQEVYEIEENSLYRLSLKVKKGDRIYFDGLNQISFGSNEKYIEEDDDGNKFIKKNCYINFYDVKNSENGFIPGYYLLTLVTGEGVSLSKWIKVKSKFFDNYSRMIDDIEKRVTGLSQSFLRGYHGVDYVKKEYSKYNAMVDILIKKSSHFKTNLDMVIKNPRTDIKSEYFWTNNMTSSLDNVSMLKMNSRKSGKKYYLRNHVVDYNNQDNIRLKNNLIIIENEVKVILREFKDYISSDEKNVLSNYVYLIDSAINYSWIKLVNTKNSILSVNTSLYGSPYSFIFSLHDSITNIKSNVNVAKRNFAYYHKSSHQLYEFWGFIKVVESLYQKGFTNDIGIFRNLSSSKNISDIIKDGLDESTTITLHKSERYNNRYINLSVNVIYNEAISKNNYESNHLWTPKTHNKPDIRLDFYDDNMIYIGSTVLDTKYRKFDTFITPDGRGDAHEQLSDYFDGIHSNDAYCADYFDVEKVEHEYDNPMGSFRNAVKLMGVIYPGDGRHNEYDEINDVISLSKIIASPDFDNRNLEKFIENSIKAVLKSYDYYVK